MAKNRDCTNCVGIVEIEVNGLGIGNYIEQPKVKRKNAKYTINTMRTDN